MLGLGRLRVLLFRTSRPFVLFLLLVLDHQLFHLLFSYLPGVAHVENPLPYSFLLLEEEVPDLLNLRLLLLDLLGLLVFHRLLREGSSLLVVDKELVLLRSGRYRTYVELLNYLGMDLLRSLELNVS